ncbi:hypothetical protein [Parafrankia sp. EUN1f]|uniref:hypothetical protein n=1 Tax=Parafrankia sp. EUN1f TaxID=102897 RepID=UPI0001C4564E|nr:hypothetical protein [Parafrankia sp. EUN1f]EFC82859.1 hypothetical protein FrEUN1fDRAFT_4056 [Parafrankia sp. EUN1f]
MTRQEPDAVPVGWVPDIAAILAAIDNPVTIETRSGLWRIGVDPESRLHGAVYRPSGPDNTNDHSPETIGATRPPVTAASSRALEQSLGFPLGDGIHRALRAEAATLRLGEKAADVQNPETAAEPQEPHNHEPDHRPADKAIVSVPGRPPITYAESLEQSRVELRWETTSSQHVGDLYQVDIVDLGCTVTEGRRELTYRLCLNGDVVFAGDDIEVPADTEPRSSETVRGLVQMLLHPEADVPLNARQRSFLTRHHDDVAGLVAEHAGPHQVGDRVEVRLPDGRLLTGEVKATVPAADGEEIRSYQWTPDGDLFAGAADGPRGTIVSPAAAVRTTLLPPPAGPLPGVPAGPADQAVPSVAVS